VTVCDADTHLIDDYFTCLTYKYAVATDRTRVIFGAPIAFYSNALDVPAIVRVTDIVWSIAVMQQLNRRLKSPCSCYSLSMDLLKTIGFWDKTGEAIGEDTHMFYKALFKTNGEIRVETVYVPVGCYDVCGETWFGAVKARYNQLIRHLWGGFDLAYVIQQSMLQNMKLSLKLIAFYEMFKARVVPATIILAGGVIPRLIITMFPIYTAYPYRLVLMAVQAIQTCGFLPYIIVLANYEILHKNLVNQAVCRGVAVPDNTRTWSHRIVDWILFPIVSIGVYTVGSVHVHILQFFTDNIQYRVASKPTTNIDLRIGS